MVGTGVTSVDFVTWSTLSFGSFCLDKENEARTPCKTTGNDCVPQTLPLTCQGLEVYLLCPPYGSGQTVTKCQPRDMEGGHWLVPSFVQLLGYKCFNKTYDQDYLHYERFHQSYPTVKLQWMNENTLNEQRKQKTWWPKRGTKPRDTASASFLL